MAAASSTILREPPKSGKKPSVWSAPDNDDSPAVRAGAGPWQSDACIKEKSRRDPLRNEANGQPAGRVSVIRDAPVTRTKDLPEYGTKPNPPSFAFDAALKVRPIPWRP
jgi:hypothetical protein